MAVDLRPARRATGRSNYPGAGIRPFMRRALGRQAGKGRRPSHQGQPHESVKLGVSDFIVKPMERTLLPGKIFRLLVAAASTCP